MPNALEKFGIIPKTQSKEKDGPGMTLGEPAISNPPVINPPEPPSQAPPQDNQLAKQTKTKVVPDNQDQPEELRQEIRKHNQQQEKDFLDFGNELKAISENQLKITQQGLKDREALSSSMASQIREMSREQFNLTIDALGKRRAAQNNMALQMKKVEEINNEISNFSKRIDPNFFWNRRSAQAQNSIIEGLVGMASSGVNPVSLINLIQGDIAREVNVQKENIGTDIALLKEKQSGAQEMFGYMKQIYDDDLVIEQSINAAYKEKASQELQRIAFLLQEGETQTNLMLASEEVSKSAVQDRMNISKQLADNYSSELASEFKLMDMEREKEEFEFQKSKAEIGFLQDELKAEETRVKEAELKKEKLQAVSTVQSDRSQEILQSALEERVYKDKETGEEVKLPPILSKEEAAQIDTDRVFTLRDKSLRSTTEADEKDNNELIRNLSKLEEYRKYFHSKNAIAVKAFLATPKGRKIKEDMKAIFTRIKAIGRIPYTGGGQLSEAEQKLLDIAARVKDVGTELFTRELGKDILQQTLRDAKKRGVEGFRKARFMGGNAIYRKLYDQEIKSMYKKIEEEEHSHISKILGTE